MKWLASILVVLAAAASGAVASHWRWIDLNSINHLFEATAREPARVPTPAPAPVEVAIAREISSTEDITTIGTLMSDESVQLASEVPGRIAEIRFEEGQSVTGGNILVSLDNAMAKASEEEMRVRHELANANHERARRLSESGTGTTRDLDTALAELNTAASLLNSQRVQLAKHDITAPFDGIIGLRNVSAGSYVAAGTVLVNIEKIDILKAAFKIPEANLQKIAIGQAIEVSVDAIPDRIFAGTIYAIDPMLDVNGRAISVRARLPNPDLALRPGLFARITVRGQIELKTIAVPESAVIARGQEHYVWTIVDGKARETRITVHSRRAGDVQIEGVESGAIVVTAGHPRLQDGVNVDVVGDTAAKAES